MAHHHSISMHKLHISDNAMGVFLAIGVIFLFAMSVFSVYWFVLGAIVLVAIMCGFLFRWYRQHKIEINDLSILEKPMDKTQKS